MGRIGDTTIMIEMAVRCPSAARRVRFLESVAIIGGFSLSLSLLHEKVAAKANRIAAFDFYLNGANPCASIIVIVIILY